MREGPVVGAEDGPDDPSSRATGGGVTAAGAARTTGGPKEPRRRRGTLAQQEARAGIALLSPTLIVVLFMVVIPILWTIVIAFQSLRLRNLRTRLFDFEFTLRNFDNVLTSPGFLDALKVTLIYSIVGTFLSIGLGLVAALVVRKPFRGRTLVRASMLLPYVAPVVAVTFVWQIMLNPELGIVNAIGADVFGWKDPIPFLEQRTGTLSVFGFDLGVPLALVVVILYQAWRYFPFSFLFILARLQALPGELDEAARVDGANATQRFFAITMPQLQPVLYVVGLIGTLWAFNVFDVIWLLTQGGPSGTTQTLPVLIYDRAFNGFAMGEASTISVLLCVFLLIFSVLYIRFVPAGESDTEVF
jgi:multiple sugar transport system permease protein